MQQDESQVNLKEPVSSDEKTEECAELLAKVVKDYGGRLTDERRVLLQTVIKMKGHFEAEEVHQALRKRGHKVSLATIYRNLTLLVEAGIIRRVSLAHGDQTRMQFECVWGQKHHDHLVCLGCEKKIEFSYPAIDVLQDAVAREYGFVLAGHHLELLGFCQACREKNATSLVNLKAGAVARIVALSGGKAIVNRLNGFGLREGRVVRLVRFAPFGGPLLIQDVENQSTIMTARNLAAYVLVQEVSCEE